jgi:hypothetical protein
VGLGKLAQGALSHCANFGRAAWAFIGFEAGMAHETPEKWKIGKAEK